MKALLLCLLALTFGVHAQTPADISQDRALAKDQARQDKVTVKLADRLEGKASANSDAQDEANVAANTAQDVAAMVVTIAQDERTAENEANIKTIQAQSLTDRQFLIMLTLAIIAVLISVWWMQYRSTSRLEGASKSTWKGVEVILLRTELLQAYLEREAPDLLAEFEAALQEADAK